MPIRFIALAAAALVASSALADTASDPYVWLEEASSDRAIDWVKAENAKTVAVLESDPRYAEIHAKALAIAEAKDRIPEPVFRSGRIYNFWQDADRVRGIWRVSSLEQYRRNDPPWRTALDLDALAALEHANWYWKGADCLPPQERRCLLNLSDGGEDAVTVREFDLPTRQFVGNGFQLPSGKQQAAWIDGDRLIVARDWGPAR
jgi:prolyl oligopeptidase